MNGKRINIMQEIARSKFICNRCSGVVVVVVVVITYKRITTTILHYTGHYSTLVLMTTRLDKAKF